MSTSTTPALANPYIGPRSFETGEKLFGRDRELRDLLHLLVAERVVLLYSPSGAGKSSLIKAALLPALAKKSFVGLPPVRVNQELPPGAPPGANRYVFSTLLSLEEHHAPAERLPLGELAALRLLEYVLQRVLPEAQQAGSDPVLIFDQFEEVLTADPANLAAKHAFFEQLGQTLADRRLWALFAMREDYLAALDPYLGHIPSRFKDTFRLDLLGAAAARQAMQGPAKAAGVTFTPEAAECLTDELRRTTVQRPDGTSEQVLGPYVEPVQLQVVCLRLWDKLFGQPSEREPLISLDDIADVGDVDSALAAYYVDRVQAVAATGVQERDIRDWVDRELITPQGQRSQVMREAGQSAGLDNTAIMHLIDAHLVRADERHGIVWYELAHDRLVGPIQQNNAAWRSQNLTAFQRQAILWEEQQRTEGLLIQGEALREAERWAEANAQTLTEGEAAFLEASRRAREQRRQQERTARLMRRRLVVSLVAGALAIGLSVLAVRQYQIASRAREDADNARTMAEQQTRIARVRQLAAQAAGAQQQNPQRSLLLAATSQQILEPGDPPMLGEQTAVLPLVYGVGGQPLLGSAGQLQSVFSPDGRWVAAQSEDAHAKLWRADDPARPPLDLGRARELLISADGSWLATLDHAGNPRLWRMGVDSPVPVALAGVTGGVAHFALSPDGRWLATGGVSSRLRLWRLDTPSPSPLDLGQQPSAISRLIFSPDGQWLVVREESDQNPAEQRAARLWRLGGARPSAIDLGQIASAGFSTDSRWLATAGQNTNAQLWRLDTGAPSPIDLKLKALSGQQPQISADGRWLSLVDSDEQPRLWRIDSGAPAPVALGFPPQRPGEGAPSQPSGAQPSPQPGSRPAAPDAGSATEVRFRWLGASPDARQLVGFGPDGAVWRWQLGAARPVAEELGRSEGLLDGQFSGDSRWIVATGVGGRAQLWPISGKPAGPINLDNRTDQPTLSPDGRWLITTGDLVGTLRIWQLSSGRPRRTTVQGHEHPITSIAFSPSGRQFVSFSEDEPARLWQVDTPTPAALTLSDEQQPAVTVTFSPDGQWAATNDLSGTLRLLRLSGAAAPQLEFEQSGQDITQVAFSPDGRWLLTRGARAAQLVRLDGAAPSAARLGGLAAPLSDAAFSPDSRWLLTASEAAPAQLWRLDSGAPTPTSLDTQPSGGARFSPDGLRLATLRADGRVRLWRLDTPAPEAVDLLSDPAAYSLTFSPDGRWLLVTLSGGPPRLWDLRQDTPGQTALDPQARGESRLNFSPDGRWLALDYADNTTWLQPLGQPSAQAVKLGQEIVALAFSKDTRRLAVGLSEQIEIWRLDRPQVAGEVFYREPNLQSLHLSPDGRWLSASYLGGTLKVWRVANPETPEIEVDNFGAAGSEDSLVLAEFSPDGTWLALRITGTPAQLWRLGEQQVASINYGDDSQQIDELAFSPDGRWLLTKSGNGPTRLQLIKPSELIERFCSLAGRNLSLAEWDQTGGAQTFAKVCPRLPYHPSMYDVLLGQRQIVRALGGHSNDRLSGASQELPAPWLVRMASGISQKSPQEALLAYVLARQIDPELRGVSDQALGALCQSTGQSAPGPLALEVCTGAIALDPGNLWLYYARAVTRMMTDDLAGARDDLERFRRLAADTFIYDKDEAQKQAQEWLETLTAGKNPLAAP